MDFVSGINNAMTKDGQNSATADLNMGGNKLKNGKTATLVNDFTIVSDIQNSVHTYVTSTGSANAYVITLATAPDALVAGQPFSFKANFANTGAVTLDVNSLGTIALERYGSIPLLTGEIRTNQIVTARYDGTKYQALSINDVPVPVASKFGAIVVQNITDNGFELLTGQGTSGKVLTSNGADALPSFNTVPGAWTLIETQVASSSATIDFTTSIDSTHNLYAITLTNIIPASTATEVHLVTSTDGGSNYDVGAADYEWHHMIPTSGAGTYTGNNGGADEDIQIAANVQSSASEGGFSGVIYMYNPSNSATHTNFTWQGANSVGARHQVSFGAGRRKSVTDVDAIRFLMSVGNITSGTFKLYGIL